MTDGKALMGQSEPPTIVLVWCPDCGRTDRFKPLNLPPRKHMTAGATCKGKPIRVQYEPVRQQPLRGPA